MAEGRRESKKQSTRQLLADVAMRLFEEQGYDGTTVDQIAHEAGLSTRTVTRYFRYKEEVIFGYEAETLAALLAAVRRRPRPSLDIASLAHPLVWFAAAFEGSRDAVLARARVVASNRALRIRSLQVLQSWRDGVAAELAAEAQLQQSDLRVQIVAGAFVAAFDAAMTTWVASNGAEALPTLARRALRLLQRSASRPA